MASDDKTTFPRIPEKNWWVLRDQFAKALPKEVTISYLKSLLQLNTEGAAKNLIGPLRQLGLISEDNKPTDLANDWRSDAKYSEACARMLELYPQELRDLYSDANVERKALEDWFQYNGKLGDVTARQAAALYHLLLDASPKSSSDVLSAKKSSNATRPAKTKKKPAIGTKAATPSVVVPEPSTPLQLPVPIAAESSSDWFSLHIDLQIHISPEADADQIDNIFASMAKHIMSMRGGLKDNEGN